jgi:hypothetical protein
MLPSVNALLLGSVGVALGIGVYFAAAWTLGVQEVRAITLGLRRAIAGK